MHKAVSDFLAEVCKPVKSKELREAVRSEIASHLLCKTEELREDGFSEEEAALKAVEEMGTAEKIGERLAAVYKPDYAALWGGAAMLLIVMFSFFSAQMTINPGAELKYLVLHFIDPPEFLAVALTAAALLSFGGYKNNSAEELLRRFSKTSIYSGLLWSIMWPLAFIWGADVSELKTLVIIIVVVLLSLFYGVLFSALAHALIPLTPTARLRKTPVSNALLLN